jgi:hypothetical protein
VTAPGALPLRAVNVTPGSGVVPLSVRPETRHVVTTGVPVAGEPGPATPGSCAARSVNVATKSTANSVNVTAERAMADKVSTLTIVTRPGRPVVKNM